MNSKELNPDIKELFDNARNAYKSYTWYRDCEEHMQLIECYGEAGSIIWRERCAILDLKYNIEFDKFNRAFVKRYQTSITTEIIEELLS